MSVAVRLGHAPGEEEIVGGVRVDDAWSVVEELSHLVRESGTADERRAVSILAGRLARYGVRYRVHEPELLISLPREASLAVGGRTFHAKTPSMARSTAPGGETAPLVHRPTGFARTVHELFESGALEGEVAGKLVLTEGFALPNKVSDLQARGAAGVVFISPGERIHEMICTPVWGSPDLTTVDRRPTIPVVSVSRPDGEELVALLAGGEAPATIVATHEERWRPIPVVVAEIPGAVEPDRFVLVHGHLDSWHHGVGDNATGDATLLELARALSAQPGKLARSVRIAWWSGHSHGRYAGSTWFADTFANDLLRNCVCHINCDSPGCRDATAYEDVTWMAETEGFAKQVIADVAGIAATGRHPARAGDLSFNNLGLSTLFMLSSNIPAPIREERGLYGVGGCGGNIEWHTEADELEIADAANLLRDIRVYATAAVRAANLPVHPLDFGATVKQIRGLLDDYAPRLDGFVDLRPVADLAREAEGELRSFAERNAALDSVEAAAAANAALREIGRELVPTLYARDGRFRQDPALELPLLPELGAAAAAVAAQPDGVVRIEATRGRNRLENALLRVHDRIAAAGRT